MSLLSGAREVFDLGGRNSLRAKGGQKKKAARKKARKKKAAKKRGGKRKKNGQFKKR